MKKYILLFAIMITTISFAQTITTKIENANAAQYELLKKANEYYPDITLNEKVTNFYIEEKIVDTKQEFNLTGTKFSSYTIGISPDNKKLLFEFVSDENGKIYGDITFFKGRFIRTNYDEKKGEIEVSINGKAVYKKKI
jgi:hypothetical protein